MSHTMIICNQRCIYFYMFHPFKYKVNQSWHSIIQGLFNQQRILPEKITQSKVVYAKFKRTYPIIFNRWGALALLDTWRKERKISLLCLSQLSFRTMKDKTGRKTKRCYSKALKQFMICLFVNIFSDTLVSLLVTFVNFVIEILGLHLLAYWT